MATSIIRRLNLALNRFEQLIGHYFGNGFPPAALCTVDTSAFTPNHSSAYQKNFLDLESLKDAFLFAVPVQRRSIERRRMRRFGFKKWVWKPHVPKTNILMCLNCGHNHLPNTLCPNCYSVVKEETEKLQQEIVDKLGLSPVEKEVVVLYAGEKTDFSKNKQIIEVPRKRPDWFHSNLMQSTTEPKNKHNNEVNHIKAKVHDS